MSGAGFNFQPFSVRQKVAALIFIGLFTSGTIYVFWQAFSSFAVSGIISGILFLILGIILLIITLIVAIVSLFSW